MYIWLIEIFVVILVFSLIYMNILYPVLLVLLAKISKNEINNNTITPRDITVLIAAYNEEVYLTESIESIYNSGYPIDKIKIIVGSDGSTDKTVSIVNILSKKYPNLFCRDLPRVGKNVVLNTLMKEVETDIVFFLDADTRINKGVIERLLVLFEDKDVGGAQARLNIVDTQNENNVGNECESLYQKYEAIVRVKESEIYSTVNAIGAFYAVRRELIREIPNNLVSDDLYNVLTVNSLKKRVIFDADSIVNEIREKSLGEELNRRIRLASGGLSAIMARKELLGSEYKWSRFFLLSHKLSRYFIPIILILLLFMTPIIAFINSILFWPVFLGQFIIYFLALIGKITKNTKFDITLFRIPLFFVSMCIGYALGWIRFLKGGQSAIWERIDTIDKNRIKL